MDRLGKPIGFLGGLFGAIRTHHQGTATTAHGRYSIQVAYLKGRRHRREAAKEQSQSPTHPHQRKHGVLFPAVHLACSRVPW
jgi:hypothetical protein